MVNAVAAARHQPYPEPLRRAIIAQNYPILRRNISSYLHQIERAVARHDLVSVHHRTVALLASYFDILFAINRLPHPGEKRLMACAKKLCARIPAGMEEHVNALISADSNYRDTVIPSANSLVDGLEALLLADELI